MKPFLYLLIAALFQCCSDECSYRSINNVHSKYFQVQISKGGKQLSFRKVITFAPFFKEAQLSKVPLSYRHQAVHIEVTDSLDQKDTVVISYRLTEPSYGRCPDEAVLSPKDFSIMSHTFDTSYKVAAYAHL